MLITTTDVLQGAEIAEYIGLVAVRVTNAKGGIGKALDKVTDTTMTDLTAALTAAAEKVNANAVIGLKVTPESMTTFAVGTAVKLK